MNKITPWKTEEDRFILNDTFTLCRADNIEFGIHETIYSNLDLELNYSWKKQTTSKLDCDHLFWIFKDDKRIGGIHIAPNICGSLFIEAPHLHDRFVVLSAINNALLKWSDIDKPIKIYGVIPNDIMYLQNLGYAVISSRRVMIRPTEIFDGIDWHDDYIIKVPTVSDAPEIGQLFLDSYSGGIDYEVFGKVNLDEAVIGAKRILDIYQSNNTLDGSILVYDKHSNRLVAACIAGMSGYCDNDFSEIGDLVVHPAYRKLGLASKMIEHTLTQLKSISPATILCVTSGNPAEALYCRMGFFAGVKFTNMYYNNETSV